MVFPLMVKSMLLGFGLLAGIIVAADAPVIRGGNFANWWLKGQTVSFKSGTALPDTAELTVKVYNSADELVREDKMPAAVFNSQGWTWKAGVPGFFEAEFIVNDTVVGETYTVNIRKQDLKDKRKYNKLASRDFTVSRHSFVVAPAGSAEPDDVSPCFSVSPHFSMYQKEIPLLRLIGFNSIRIHGIRWANVEKERGKLDWSSVDDFMRIAREQGFKDKNIIFNVFATPRWASTRPRADWINICIHEYSTVIPRDMNDWRNFLRQLIRRYPGVERYELWNEPHLPGFSCFWDDTPENFVELLKAGYETVKREKPGSVVWLGGIGMRYLPFYDALLRLGGGDYFDVLALHCKTITPDPFNEINRKYNVPVKPAVTSEWHAMLLKPMMADFPSEKILARDMLIRFLDQKRAGIGEICFFSMLNLSRMEKETLPFYREHNMTHPHVSGLFRHLPYIQPRYPALAWCNFTALVKGQLEVGDGFIFGKNNELRVITLRSDSGPMLLFWNDSDKDIVIEPRLFKAIGNASRVISPEGVEVSVDGQFVVRPEIYYIAGSPDIKEVGLWNDNKGNVLVTHKAKMELEDKYHGTYRSGPLFDKEFKVLNPDGIAWQNVDNKVSIDRNIPAGELSGRFAVGFSPEFMDLLVEVNDQVHHCVTDSIRIWNDDSIQFGLDVTGDGYDTGRLEFESGLVEGVGPVIWKVRAPDPDGDIPVRCSHSGSRADYARVAIERVGDMTVYKLRIEASELFPFVFSAGKAIRFSLLINNNDGKGRSSYLEWASGIGGAKNPAAFGTLTIQLQNKEVISQKDLKDKGWRKDYEIEFRHENSIPSVKVIGTSLHCSGVRTGTFPVTPGAAYVLSMEVRGSAGFQVAAYVNKSKRKDIITQTPLSSEWKKYEIPISLEADAANMSILCFAWNQPACWFEIRNFKLQAR